MRALPIFLYGGFTDKQETAWAIHFILLLSYYIRIFTVTGLNRFILFGIFGAYLIGVELLGLDGGSYISSLENAVVFGEDVLQSIVKSLAFGVILALIATYRGYTCEPNAAGVSRATTSTVVTTSVCILLADYVLTSMWGV